MNSLGENNIFGERKKKIVSQKDIRECICNWVDSSQDRDYWRALVNMALDFRVP